MPQLDHPVRTSAALATEFGPVPFTLRDAERCGFTRDELRAAVGRGQLEHLGYDSYAIRDADITDRSVYLRRVTTALLRRWNAVGSHESAAAALGLPCPATGPWRGLPVVVTNPKTPTRERRGIITIQSQRDQAAEVVTPWGVVTDPVRTAFDLGGSRDLRRSLVVADAVARQIGGPADRPVMSSLEHREFVRTLMLTTSAAWAGLTNSAKARAVLAVADPAAESPAESTSRALIIEAGMPLPLVGAAVKGASGKTYYGDLVWVQEGVIGEVDGLSKYATSDVVVQEKLREDDLRRAGIGVIRWTGVEARRNPRVVIKRISDGLSRR